MDASPLAAAVNPAVNPAMNPAMNPAVNPAVDPAPVAAAGAAPAASVLLLADSRLPAGGHAHSGGVEPAAAAGAVTDLAGLADFLRGRLATAGLVAAALAAAA
ncbi:MAG TPA: hypothetical protein VF069_06420, partial [Streptosporangiaceae bacterium]